jgi:hypothetical protein
MKKTFEEVKSLIAIGGLTAVGYVAGAITAKCYGDTSLIMEWAGMLIGASIGILLIARRLFKAFS